MEENNTTRPEMGNNTSSPDGGRAWGYCNRSRDNTVAGMDSRNFSSAREMEDNTIRPE